MLSKWAGQAHRERTGCPTGAPAAPQGSESQAAVGGGREGRRGGKSRPAAHLIQLRLGRNPQLRVYGALQCLDDPVEVHGPGRGLRPPGPAGRVAAGLSPGPFGPGRHREPPYPNPLPPTQPPAATCCATLTPRPLSSLLRPPPTTLSPFTLYDSRWEEGEQEVATPLRPPLPLARAALTDSSGRRHDVVRKTLYACQ